MLIVLIVAGLLMVVLGVYLMTAHDFDGTGSIFGVVGTVIVCTAVIFMIFNGLALYDINNINPAKIEYLKQNNAEIEARLVVEIENFAKLQQDIYASYTPQPGANVSLSVPPELQSTSALVVSYMETVKENNDEIRRLELIQLNRRAYAYWNYFGS